MAAYAALLSLMHIIDNLRLYPRPPLRLHHKQAHLLTEKAAHLQQFLERYNPRLGYSTEADPLELRIADAAYAAKDVIESHIVDRITGDGGDTSSDALYQALDMVIQDMALLESEAMEIERRLGVLHHVQEKSMATDSQRPSSMVGVKDVKIQLMDKLTSDCRDLLIIPIVGMGGTGKTTLARNIYQERRITEHFDTCAWATISQEYSVEQFLAEILGLDNDHRSREGELGENLHKHLFNRKYLIVMDDMWDVHAWDRARVYFPNNENGSRVVVTTRLSNLASGLSSRSSRLEMELLDEAHSWELLSKTVFGEESCPLHLEEIGKRIAKSCKGLPLSIVVIGGLLAKSEHTREFWEYIERNLSPIVNLEDDERCLKILHLSYKQLPVHLKPCFLYMGIFSEDEAIHASTVVRLWIAEGFIRPVSGKSFKEVGKMYVKELADRNLVLVHEIGSVGGIKKCKMHDLLRDFCLREARKERFYSVVDGGGETNARRCIVAPTTSMEEAAHALQSMPLARSLIWRRGEKPPSLRLRWLRILQSAMPFVFQETMLQLVNLRHVAGVYLKGESVFHSMQRFWNLETLIVEGNGLEFSLPAEIWCMPRIRHIQLEYAHLPDPPAGHAAADGSDDNDGGGVLRNLHTLKEITNFKCSKDVVKRIPNIKKLGVYYEKFNERLPVENLVSLDKLESLEFAIHSMNGQSLNFPHSLKKLTLRMINSKFSQQVLGMIGGLPHLEKLRLDRGEFEGRKWETVEGHFCRLKFLEILLSNIAEWKMESSHFPCLERLVLRRLPYMDEIPLEVAAIPTLESIYFVFSHTHGLKSLLRIVEIQEELYGDVSIRVLLRHKAAVIYAEEWSDVMKECRNSPYIRFEV
ncbi:putative late blight resistance protein R1B-17 isoform X3 [Salvia divinorum]|uniref:Late blight resistance protein R1B-17 isoform X3 n=1 Tax=Salvia divinorum TaxID=28513 RepID=A0ABD1G224_SALDI